MVFEKEHAAEGNEDKIYKLKNFFLSKLQKDFSYGHLDKLDFKYHKFIPGNHDNYSILKQNDILHNLGDFGTWEIPGFPWKEVFFIRGAYSVDKQWRIPGVSWWSEEELTEEELKIALNEYKSKKPEFVVTHDAPQSIINTIGLPEFSHLRTRTAEYLQKMLDIHRPKWWIFGHHHVKYIEDVNETKFICLPELETVTFSLKGSENIEINIMGHLEK